MSYHGRFEEDNHLKPKKKAGKIVLSVILILVLLIGGAVLWGIRYFNDMFGKMDIVVLDDNLYETYTEETTLPEETALAEEKEAETTNTIG